MKAIFYLDLMASFLPMLLMIMLSSTLITEYVSLIHFYSVNEKVNKLISTSTALIYDHSSNINNNIVFGNISKPLPHVVETEIKTVIDEKPTGPICIYRYVLLNGEIKRLFFCTG